MFDNNRPVQMMLRSILMGKKGAELQRFVFEVITQEDMKDLLEVGEKLNTASLRYPNVKEWLDKIDAEKYGKSYLGLKEFLEELMLEDVVQTEI